MNKALLKFSPLENAYAQKFGIMPDRHYEKLLGEKCQLYNTKRCKKCYEGNCVYMKEVGDTINANMREVWQEQKEFRKEFHVARSTPFQGGM